MPSFGTKSNNRLKTTAWDLQRVFREVVRYHDCTVLEGHRGESAQREAYRKKRTKVDWPDSKHNSYPSEAIDVAPYPIPEDWGDLKKDQTLYERDMAWKERVKFYELAAVVLFVAGQLDVKIRWGGDWSGDKDYRDQTFDDLLHYEIL